MFANRVRYGSAVAAAMAMLAAAACGSGGSGTSPVTTVQNAAKATEAQHTAALNFSVTSDAGGAPSTGVGGVDFGTKLVQGLFVINGVPGVPDGDKADGIVQAQIIYAHLHDDVLKKKYCITKPWLKVDTRELSNGGIAGIDLGTIGLAGLINPHLVFVFVPGVTSATKGPTMIVNGTNTTQYDTTVDLNQAVKGLTGIDATLINKDLAAYTSPTFPMQLWIDGSGLIRKATVSVSIKGDAGKAPTKSMATFEFPKFAVPVDLTLPPPDQTAGLSDILAAVVKGQGCP